MSTGTGVCMMTMRVITEKGQRVNAQLNPQIRDRSGSAGRGQSRTAALATRAELIAAANIVDVSVPAMSLPRLIRLSTAHYNELNPGKRAADFASDEAFMTRICVNYLRHACSGYDSHRDFIRQMASPKDRAEIGAVIKGRILRSIANTYPMLIEEARRQARREDTPPHRKPLHGKGNSRR